MEDFYSLSDKELKFLDDTKTEKFIPTIIYKSSKDFLSLGRVINGLLSKMGYDFEENGYNKQTVINFETEYDFKYFPKYFRVVSLTPEAHKLFIEHRWHLFKIPHKFKMQQEEFEILFLNEEQQYIDALTVPLVIADLDSVSEIFKFVVNKFPLVTTSRVINNGKAIINCEIKEKYLCRGMNYIELQKDICQSIKENFENIKVLSFNGVELGKNKKQKKEKKIMKDEPER